MAKQSALYGTQASERYNRYEPQVAEGLTHMFVIGVKQVILP
ncbi:hypothetical protein [Ktedonobacter racemifer]|uniref:Uncharacterized protein n=1 Tax=Ktedonobacter racemifer DSM 44963 TaxID=485913 RepID=D6TBS6_KTERA|nr:hypothetical protein [Ktedonobacter racemifer]EFH89858.1 hypothetical protein Krac_11440 [Ktedonobacter racemifer DSM 44963]